MWRAQMDDLRDTYRVVALDLPGHGRLADRPFTLTGASDEVGARHRGGGRRARGRGRPVARRLRRDGPGGAPSRSSSAAWSCPARRRNPSASWRRRISRSPGSWIGSMGRRSMRSTRGSSGPDFPRPSPTRSSPAASGRPVARRPCGPSSGNASRRASPRIPGPTLIVNGEWDLLFRLAAGTFARSARDPRRVRLAGATHLANLDRPAAFSFAVRRFVEGLREPDRRPAAARRPARRGSGARLGRPTPRPLTPYPPRFDARP